MRMFLGIFMKLAKKKSAAIVVGLVLVIFLIMYGGRYFRMPLNTRLLVVVVLLFLAILYFQIKQMQAKRGSAKLEESIKSQADEQKLGTRPEKRGEIETLKVELTKAIDALKQSKLGQGRSGRSALYALPWYMFIGPPAAGKTTAIINSGLEFPYQSEIRGVGGTRNCDWFFSKSAILLDTAGRYTTGEEDRAEWQAFLEMLKKYRSRRPINGVLVGVSITDLVGASFEDIEWHAKNIRSRIDELVERLGTRFPVYLVFTKCDLLQGFVELFENLSRRERQQIWGATLSLEQQSAGDPREIFNHEFQVLLKSINEFRMKRLSVPTKSEDRGRLYVFPLEFATIQEQVGYFISHLFQPNPYQENPFFRGFYFTSGTQEGVPMDLVIQAVAKQFDLPPSIVTEPEVEKKSYFIKDLFTDVIVPDQNMVTQTSGSAARRNFFRIGTVVASAALLGLFILWVFQGFVRGRLSLNAVRSSAVRMEQVDWQANIASIMSNLGLLDGFRQQIVRLENYENNPPFFRTGMNRGGKILPSARELYYDRFSFFANSSLFNILAQKMSDYTGGAVYRPGRIVSYLTSYLLMTSETKRLVEDPAYAEFLKNQLLGILDEVFSARLSESQYLELRPLMARQIDFYVDELGQEGMPSFSVDERLVARVRQSIAAREKENVGTVYETLKLDEGARQFSVISMAQAVGEQPHDILTGMAEIPGVFTASGYEEYYKAAASEHVKRISEDDWVMGTSASDTPRSAVDSEALVHELKRMYFTEYGELWWGFLRNARYLPFEDLSGAADFLNILGDPEESPLIALLTLTSQQTTYVEQAPEKKGILRKGSEKLGDLFSSDDKPSASDLLLMEELTQEFSDIHDMIPAPGEEVPEQIKGLLDQYVLVASVLEGMSDDPETKARDYAIQVLQEAGELPEGIQFIRRTLSDFDPDARRALFEQPLVNAWRAVLDQAQNKINETWKNRVYDEFETRLADRYPFNREGRDAPLADVEDFFKPGEGVLRTFVTEELAPFLDLEDFSARTWEDHGIQISQASLAAFRVAEGIEENLFAPGGFPVNFRLKPDSYETISGTEPYILKIEINIDGQDLAYEMGHANYQEFFWPHEGTKGARLQLVMNEKNLEPQPKEFSGWWGWFRLLEEADIRREGGVSTEFNVSWTFSLRGRYEVRVKYLLQARSAANPFRDFKNLFNFQCPRALNE